MCSCDVYAAWQRRGLVVAVDCFGAWRWPARCARCGSVCVLISGLVRGVWVTLARDAGVGRVWNDGRAAAFTESCRKTIGSTGVGVCGCRGRASSAVDIPLICLE